MKQFLLGIAIGGLLIYLVQGMFEKKLPEAFEIERGGKVVGYADTRLETTEFVLINGVKSPGMFIAFPIFGDKEEMRGLN